MGAPEPESAGTLARASSELSGRIGKYQILRLIGRGGMGAVYQGFDPLLERDVALKIMLPEIADNAEHKRRFEREARAVGRLTHPNIVTLFDLGYHTDGSPYIVMELLKGRDLLQVMRHGPALSLRRKLATVLHVLAGLGHAHKAGIVHRDIKPANVFIKEDGRAKIMDFGVARLDAGSATAMGKFIGTASYMSPEQARGLALDGRSDLFSVGCMLCELLTGRRPFEADSVVATLFKITTEPPVFLLPAGPEHEALRPILEKALAKDPAQRHETAAAFGSALRGVLATLPAETSSPCGPRAGAGAASTGTDTGSSDSRTGLVRVPSAYTSGIGVSEPPADPTPLFSLLRTIYVDSKSGQLHFSHAQGRRILRFLKGQILHARSEVVGERLSDVLVRYGVLTQADLDKAMDRVLGENARLGIVLIRMGCIERTQLEEAVGLHAREVLFNVLDEPGVTVGFEELAEDALETDLVCSLSMGEVILEATRRVQDPELVRRGLGDPSRILMLSSNPALRSQRITFTPTDGFILSRVDGRMSMREVLSLVPVPAEDAERSLFGLLCTGTVDCMADIPSRRITHAGTRIARGESSPSASQKFPP
jgi:serine/threonine protein kinase